MIRVVHPGSRIRIRNIAGTDGKMRKMMMPDV
jgi:hypothetical protein